jgi:hypothetical protein
MSEEERPKIMPVVIGIALTCVLLACLAYAAKLRNAAESQMAPQLTITGPSQGAVTDSPLVIRFTAGHPLDLMPTGWGHDNFHLHASINGVEYMPAAADIIAQDQQYAWTIPTAPRGEINLYLGWADHMHRALQKGMTDTIRATLK